MIFGCTRYLGEDDLAFGLIAFKVDFGELGRAAHARVFHQDVMGPPDLVAKMGLNLRRTGQRLMEVCASDRAWKKCRVSPAAVVWNWG